MARILSIGDAAGGNRAMELFPRHPAGETVRAQLAKLLPGELFPSARDPQAAMSGLYLYFQCLDEAHQLVQASDTNDRTYWHAIMHRMEGDIGNSRYWFHHIPSHPVYPRLRREAELLGYLTPGSWDPSAFASFCERAPGTNDEDLAKRVQLAEWQLLFDCCAAPVAAARDGAATA